MSDRVINKCTARMCKGLGMTAVVWQASRADAAMTTAPVRTCTCRQHRGEQWLVTNTTTVPVHRVHVQKERVHLGIGLGFTCTSGSANLNVHVAPFLINFGISGFFRHAPHVPTVVASLLAAPPNGRDKLVPVVKQQ